MGKSILLELQKQLTVLRGLQLSKFKVEHSKYYIFKTDMSKLPYKQETSNVRKNKW